MVEIFLACLSCSRLPASTTPLLMISPVITSEVLESIEPSIFQEGDGMLITVRIRMIRRQMVMSPTVHPVNWNLDRIEPNLALTFGSGRTEPRLFSVDRKNWPGIHSRFSWVAGLGTSNISLGYIVYHKLLTPNSDRSPPFNVFPYFLMNATYLMIQLFYDVFSWFGSSLGHLFSLGWRPKQDAPWSVGCFCETFWWSGNRM